MQLPDRESDGNLFRIVGPPLRDELFERLAGSGSGEVLVERIVSWGHATRRGLWLDQDRDEWVVLLEGEAELLFADGSRLRLAPGDHVLITAGERHRVEWTREDPPCVWLAVHATGLSPPLPDQE